MRIYTALSMVRIEDTTGAFIKDINKGDYRMERYGANGLRIVSIKNYPQIEAFASITNYNAADPLQRIENNVGTPDANLAAAVLRLETLL